MKKKNLICPVLLVATAISAHSVVIDWDSITHWTGEGDNRAALVVQFNDGGSAEAYVWGFRWNSEDYDNGTPSGEEMFRAIAKNSNDLLLFTQYTGSMGCTVDGIGYFNPDGEHLASSISFDFDGAKEDSRISFDYYSPNELMGQTKAPAAMTTIYCRRAINEAVTTNIIEHPINALDYGYPAYDYDWWQPTTVLDSDNQRWNAGWYDGYWSYWVGGEDLDQLSYSGLGYSSRKISDGQVDGWKYTLLDGPVGGNIDGFTGASEQWGELNYHHFDPAPATSSVSEIDLPSTAVGKIEAIYKLNGEKVGTTSTIGLSAGVYIVKSANGKTHKLLVK